MTNDKDHIKKNINLEDIPKKELYSVSANYFDKLPSRIQERAIQSTKKKSFGNALSLSLRFALPGLALVFMLFYFGVRWNNDDINVQAMLDDIPTEDLISYIQESDITTDELLSLIDIEELDIDGMVEEEIQLFNDDDLDDLMEVYPELENEI
jgi:hypothetical protein